MSHPTIKDLATAAEVSVSTVNRLIGGHGTVRESTMKRILDAAQDIGFYGIGALEHRMAACSKRYHFAIVLLQSNRNFYKALGRALEKEAALASGCEITLTVCFVDDLSPDTVAKRIEELGSNSDGIAVVAAEHPRITEVLEKLISQSVPVISLISPLSARGSICHIGMDNWKVGRTAAWMFSKMCNTPGEIGILVGNHRYRCQEMNEIGFRSYFREHRKGFTLLEPLSTFESAAIAEEMTENLLANHSDLKGVFICGGGISGAVTALRNRGRNRNLITIGHELFDETKTALLDGTLTMVISHPLEALAKDTIATLVQANSESENNVIPDIFIPFDMFTSENL